MSRDTAPTPCPPTAWVYLPFGDCTIRWQRGDPVAYLFAGTQLETHPEERPQTEPLATIPVSTKGWTDITHVRLTGEQWAKTQRKRCRTCGMSS